MMSSYKKLLFALLLALVLGACNQTPDTAGVQRHAAAVESVVEIDNGVIEQAFEARKSDVQVGGRGRVVKLLKDDSKGQHHQKFLVKINERQTLLFAHNIDLAPRVPLQVGDEISFYGEYVYNPKGGIVHWTHSAPRGDHVAGWIMLNGKKYQ